MTSNDRRITVAEFAAMKARNEKISVLTAYDYPTAAMLDEAGIECLLVGDSLSMVVQGNADTLPVTVDEMIYHGKMVARAARRAMVVVDMPFLSFQLGKYKAIENAGRILKETGCQAVKIEGGVEQAGVIAALVTAGIPVMAHCGLRPQSVHQLGGYRVDRNRKRLVEDAEAAQQAGAFSIVLECVPDESARYLTDRLTIPTIGIGAGAGCDGQVLVLHDLLGMTTRRVPRHVKQYADLKGIITEAVTQYRNEVRDGTFPDDSQTFH